MHSEVLIHRTERKVTLILGVLYTVGVGALLFGFKDILNLSWLILWVSVLLILFTERYLTIQKGIVFTSIFLLGFISEVIGVHTGLLFGEYSYGQGLGVKPFSVPLVIGALWLSLALGARGIMFRITNSRLVRLLGGALIMVLFDLLMEPMAIYAGFWTWSGTEVPLKNYFTWFALSFIMQFLLDRINQGRNSVAVSTFILQTFFYVALWTSYFMY